MRPMTVAILDPSQQATRRSLVAFQTQLFSPRWVAAALLRATLLAGYVAVLALELATAPTFQAVVSWMGVVIAGFGTYLSWALGHASISPATVPGELRWISTPEAVNPTRWVPRTIARLVHGDFRRTAKAEANLSGIFEWVGAGLLAVGVHHFEQPALGILAAAAAVSYFWSCCLSMCVYQAWYTPEERTGVALEWARAGIGVLASGTAALILLPAFEGSWRWAVGCLCLLFLNLGSRIKQTDELLSSLTAVAQREHMRGRRLVSDELHAPCLQDVARLERELSEDPATSGFLLDQVRNIHAELREAADLDASPAYTGLWARLLSARRATILVEGLLLETDFPAGPCMSHRDRDYARRALTQFTFNAAQAGAGRADARLSRDGFRWVLTVTDDGPAPIDPQRVGEGARGLNRLRGVLADADGTVRLIGAHTMQASWFMTPEPGVEDPADHEDERVGPE